jgi:MscS family membrane protein
MLASQNQSNYMKEILSTEATLYNTTWIIEKIHQYAWAMEFVIILVVTALAFYCERKIYQKIHPRLLKKKKHWEQAVLHALHHPLACFIWLMGVTFALDLSVGYTEDSLIFRVMTPIRQVGVIVLILWFMIAFIREIEKVLLIPREGKYHLDITTVRAIGQTLRVIVIVTSLFVILQMTLGIGASAILAFAGGGSIVIGWAAKDMLANIFGGFMLFLERPFAIGDKIATVDKSIEGTVEYIGWRLTSVRTFDKVPIYIPNAFFSNTSVQNLSRMSHRRIYDIIGLRYVDSDKVPKILEEANRLLQSHKGLDLNEAAYASLMNCGSNSLEILICAFTKTTDFREFLEVKQDIFLKILIIIESNHAMCSFPITEGKLVVQLEK